MDAFVAAFILCTQMDGFAFPVPTDPGCSVKQVVVK